MKRKLFALLWGLFMGEGDPWKPIEVIPLAFAIFCTNCECLSRAQNSHCPVCGSGSTLNLSKVLNR